MDRKWQHRFNEQKLNSDLQIMRLQQQLTTLSKAMMETKRLHGMQLLADSALNVSNKTQRICALSNRSSLKSAISMDMDDTKSVLNHSNSPMVRMVDVPSNPYHHLPVIPNMVNMESNPFLSVPDPPPSPLLGIKEEDSTTMSTMAPSEDEVEDVVSSNSNSSGRSMDSQNANIRKQSMSIRAKSTRLMEEKYRRQQDSGHFIKSMLNCFDFNDWRSCWEQIMEPITRKTKYHDLDSDIDGDSDREMDCKLDDFVECGRGVTRIGSSTLSGRQLP